jgi:hypothetical protein
VYFCLSRRKRQDEERTSGIGEEIEGHSPRDWEGGKYLDAGVVDHCVDSGSWLLNKIL